MVVSNSVSVSVSVLIWVIYNISHNTINYNTINIVVIYTTNCIACYNLFLLLLSLVSLLLQAGNDVCTRTAKERINWGAYKINHTTDRIGVFVSIVSTKIPFKGAGKEYIGELSYLTYPCNTEVAFASICQQIVKYYISRMMYTNVYNRCYWHIVVFYLLIDSINSK